MLMNIQKISCQQGEFFAHIDAVLHHVFSALISKTNFSINLFRSYMPQCFIFIECIYKLCNIVLKNVKYIPFKRRFVLCGWCEIEKCISYTHTIIINKNKNLFICNFCRTDGFQNEKFIRTQNRMRNKRKFILLPVVYNTTKFENSIE